MKTKFPDQYLHVRNCRTGEEFIQPIADVENLDLAFHVSRWIYDQFSGELIMDGGIQPKLDGEFYARLMTDGRPPESVVCWTGGGFWLKAASE